MPLSQVQAGFARLLLLTASVLAAGCAVTSPRLDEPRTVPAARLGVPPSPRDLRADDRAVPASYAPQAPAGRPTAPAMAGDDDDDDDEEMAAPPATAPRTPATGTGARNRAGAGSRSSSRRGRDDENLSRPRSEKAGEGGGPTSSEEDEDDDEDAVDEQNGFKRSDLLSRLLGREDPKVHLYGWAQASFTGNPRLGNRGENFGVTPNNLANAFVLQQFYVVAEKPLKHDDAVDLGFRVDNLFGTDWQNFHSLGFFDNAFRPNHVGYDMVQAYADLHLPILTEGGVDIKAGRFYALPGYEDGIAPGRPLLSTSYLFSFAHPFTQLGVMSSWRVTDQFNISNGITNGWDRWFNDTYRPGYAGAANWNSKDERTDLSLTVNVGPNQLPRFASASLNDVPNGIVRPPGYSGLRNPFYGADSATLVTAVYVQKWGERFTSIVEGDIARETGVPTLLGSGRLASQTDSWGGVAAWLLYEWKPEVTSVARAEAFFDPSGLRTTVAGTYYETTLGWILKPKPYFWVRPELRYDWASAGRPYNEGKSNDQFTLGFDAIFLF